MTSPSLAPNRPPPARRAALTVFFALLCLYAATGRYFIDNIDGETMYLTTRALAQGRLWVIPEMTDKLNLWPGVGGQKYSVHSVFTSVAALPLYYVGLAVAKAAPHVPEGLILRAFWLLGSPLYTAATAAWLLLLLVQMGFSLRRSLFVTLVYGVGTMAFPYAKYPFSEPLSAILTIGATWFAWQAWSATSAPGGDDEADALARLSRAGCAAAWCGLFLGLAFLTRHANAVIVPFYLVFLLLAGRRCAPASWWRTLQPALAAAATFALGAAAWLWFNHARFGNVLMTGSETNDFLEMQKPNTILSTLVLLFSPGKGLILYSPIMIAATAGFAALYRRLPHFTLLLGSVLLAHTLFYASWPYYLGDWCWGPRFLVDILPLWIIPLAALPLRRRTRPLVLGLVTLSIAVQVLAVCIFYMRYFDCVAAEHGYINWVYEQPLRTPFLGALRTARELRWYRLDVNQIMAAAARPGEDLKTEMRATLDLWPVYAYRLGLPPALWLIWALQLALAAALFLRLVQTARRSEPAPPGCPGSRSP